MDFSFLPDKLKSQIEKHGIKNVYEIRIKRNEKAIINVKNEYLYSEYISCDNFDEIIKKCTEYSLYAFNDQILNGYITTKSGVRIGICGNCVLDKGEVVSISEITSLNIRIPNEIKETDKRITDNVFRNGQVMNTLIISNVSMGKTTLLKYLAKYIDKNIKKPLLIADERGEFLNVKGAFIDKITYSSKDYVFKKGIRSMSPYVMILDEIIDKEDFNAVYKAYLSGVKVITSIHADEIDKVKEKEGFIKMFDIYVKLKNEGHAGVLEKLYDKDFIELI